MKILLISENNQKTPLPIPPLGAASLVRHLENAGHDVKVLDLCFTEDYEGEIRSSIGDFDPGIIGLSIRNIDSCCMLLPEFFLERTKKIVKTIRKYCGCMIIAGGSGFSVNPYEILEFLDLEYGVVGEGEYALPMLLNKIAEKESFDDMPDNFADRKRRKKNDYGHINDLDSIYSVDYGVFHEKYGEITPFQKKLGFDVPGINMQTKRGCVLNCVYCNYPQIEGDRIRCRKPESIRNEIAGILKKSQPEKPMMITFVDNVFNFPKGHASDLVKTLKEFRGEIIWTASIHARYCDEELIKEMASSGCVQVDFSADSCSQKIIDSYRKGFTLDELRNCAGWCRKYGLDFTLFLIIGGPGEDIHSIRETVNFIDSIKPKSVLVNIGMRIYPGTGLLEYSVNEGLLDGDESLLYPKFYLSPHFDQECIDEIIKIKDSHKDWYFMGSREADLGTKLALLVEERSGAKI
jgi:radical SAM superfamily enzyme YgiQ (UPF0313 family)